MKLIETRKMISCILAILLFLLVTVKIVSADEGHDLFEKKAGGYIINLVVEEGLKVGSNEIAIKLRSEHGEAVEQAGVQVEVLLVDDHPEPEESHTDSEPKEDSHGEMNTKPKNNDHDDGSIAANGSDEHEKGQAVLFETTHEPGEFHGEIDLPKPGSWRIIVHFDIDHQEEKVEYLVEVAPSNSKAGVLFGFLAINLAAVAGAAHQKRKTASAKKEITSKPNQNLTGDNNE